MAKVRLLNYDEADKKAKEVFDDIMTTRNTKYVNNIWRALANYPPLLSRFWNQMKEVMIKPSRIDPLTKEMVRDSNQSVLEALKATLDKQLSAAQEKQKTRLKISLNVVKKK